MEVQKTKIIISGNVIESYEYEKGITIGHHKKSSVKIDRKKTDKNAKKQVINIHRAQAEIRRIIWNNVGKYTKFMTLTYKKNMNNIEQFKKDWNTFTKYMTRQDIKLKYLYVLEYQKRGALHVHVVVFNDKYIPFETINNAWKQGTTDIKVIKDIKNLGAYVSKYLSKATLDEFGTHSYRCSLGLERSQVLRFLENDERYIVLLPKNITYQRSYQIQHREHGEIVGIQTVTYKLYNGGNQNDKNDKQKGHSNRLAG